MPERSNFTSATRNPDVILLDLGLPDIDGLEVTRRLREWSQIPIIVLYRYRHFCGQWCAYVQG